MANWGSHIASVQISEEDFLHLQLKCLEYQKENCTAPSELFSHGSLKRFLRAWGAVDTAFTAITKSEKWRREYGVEQLSEQDQDIQEEIKTEKATILPHKDFIGRPIIYIAARKHNANERDIDRLTKFIVYNLETACTMCNEEIIDNLCIVFDLKDFSIGNMDYQCVKNIIWLLSRHYPERLGIGLILNSPLVFWGCWAGIKPWLNEVTANKVTFVNDDQLLEYIPPGILPLG